jgi:hypothetical protein
MVTTKEFLMSATNGCTKLARVLECLAEETCQHCGKPPALSEHGAGKLDTKVWEALRYAETFQ